MDVQIDPTEIAFVITSEMFVSICSGYWLHDNAYEYENDTTPQYHYIYRFRTSVYIYVTEMSSDRIFSFFFIIDGIGSAFWRNKHKIKLVKINS